MTNEAAHPAVAGRPPTLGEIVEQLRACAYECEAGALENNTLFAALVRMAEAQEDDRRRVRATLDAAGFVGREVSDLTGAEALETFQGRLLRHFTLPLKEGRRLGLMQCERGYVVRIFNPQAANEQQGVHVNLSDETMAGLVQGYIYLADQDPARNESDLEALTGAVDDEDIARLTGAAAGKEESYEQTI